MEEEIKKPLLRADEQIQHLKDKGITFNCISEEEAKDYYALTIICFEYLLIEKIIVKEKLITRCFMFH